MYQLVVARTSHVEELTKLCLRSLKEGHEKDFPFNKLKIKEIINECVSDSHQLAVVALVSGRVKGLVIGHVAPHAYADGLVAEDLALYVSPCLRGTDAYIELATVFDVWTEKIPGLLGSTLSLSRLNATTQVMHELYTSLGYKRSGVTYLKLRGADE